VGKNVSKTIFIDTVFVVALLNQHDQQHQRAEELAGQFEGQRFLITDGVLLEIGNGLARNYKEQAAEVIQHFLSADDVEVVRLTPELFEEALTLYRTYRDKEWGLVDCLSFVAMRRACIDEALTFDEHFVQAGFRALMRE
jgi:predicted nucleic acid-binding protein